MTTYPSEPCNRMMVAGHGYKIPCANVRPCPIHDREQVERMSDEEFELFVHSWKPWAARCSTAESGAPASPPHGPAGAPLPMPRLFEEGR